MSEAILDIDEFMDRVQDDKELLFELLDIFVSDFYGKRKELEGALSSNDYQTVEHVAHFLKGSCGNISAKSLRDIFLKFERQGMDNDLAGLEHCLEDIDKKFEELVQYIGELRGKLN